MSGGVDVNNNVQSEKNKSPKNDLAERYNLFQKEASLAIVRDFEENPTGRYLLVIPTGGGKTFTAVRSICALYDTGVLSLQEDKVVWAAHRRELLDQATNTIQQFVASNFTIATAECIVPCMLSELQSQLQSALVKVVVIDEAHHSAAPSYQFAFQREGIGVLGLTATPSRHDGKPLVFERESYSIGFPDLVKRGIILRPHIVQIEEGGRYEIDDLKDEQGLEQLNNRNRNEKIIEALLRNPEEYKKVIVYVGTKAHARDLYELMVKTPLIEHYEDISFITGDGNSRGQDRQDFIETEKGYHRSIIVNVDVLTEGYDDPKVNTAVMAKPSKSKLYYMQAVGRAIRLDMSDELKRAYVLEVEDDLPNIRYRIDNRWLFSDVSDALEPRVRDVSYSFNLTEKLTSIYEQFDVKHENRVLPDLAPGDRYTMLLFREYESPGKYTHFPLVLDNQSRMSLSGVFNFLSEHMSDFVKRDINPHAAFRMIKDNPLTETIVQKRVFGAMKNAYLTMEGKTTARFIVEGNPWITFVSFNYYQDGNLSDDIMDLVSDMANKSDILECLREMDYVPGSHLVRFPLHLTGSVGRVVTEEEFSRLESLRNRLVEIKHEVKLDEQRTHVLDLLGNSVFPVETRYFESLLIVAREDAKFSVELA